jgi:transcriptional regulator with XRE-family HTH domain
MTQRQLADALGTRKPVSVPLISSWESANRPAVPPEGRLLAYATFFATRRSVERIPYRLLGEDELTDSERDRREELARELLDARHACVQRARSRARLDQVIEPLGGPWQFGDTASVTLVCAGLPESQRRLLPEPDDPDRAYAELQRFADLDALFELYGHVRAANPISRVAVRTSADLDPDDYTTHLVALGGVDWNQATRQLLRLLDIPVEQKPGGVGGRFEVTSEKERRFFDAELSEDGALLADVGHFYRAPNPFNHERTVTVCNGMSSRGVLGTVRALTDERFRDRNADHLAERFSEADAFSVLMRVQIVDGAVMTPDWTRPYTCLHEWP